jgi:ribonuclease/clavin/mitogillin
MDEYRKLLGVLSLYQLDKIFITHHHADHHQYAPELARHFGLPIYISLDSFNRCRKKHGEDYFKDINVEHPVEGDTVGTWLGQDINVISVPGHDEGHLALAPKNLLWCIVGDLFQGVGTVVVGGAEGDMQKYVNSLRKIIQLNPRSVTPSHGITLGGTNILQKTLKHREIREEQIQELFQAGKDPNEILKIIYFDIPRKLHPYALANIESHLKKLKQEEKI